MKKVLFIGNRPRVFEKIQTLPEVEIVKTFVMGASYLFEFMQKRGLPCEVFQSKERDVVLEKIEASDFDILVSNGCPFILPVSRLKKPHQIYLNVHPSLLPIGRGRHPVNEVLLRKHQHYGATLHYIDDGVDTGGVIHQERRLVTDDLDLGLLYRLLFEVEAKVFAVGWEKLETSGFVYEGQPHAGESSYYSRKSEDQVVDFLTMSDAEIISRVRAFGVVSQGVRAKVSLGAITVFAAERMYNSDLLEQYRENNPGVVLIEYENKLLVRTLQGVVKITSYKMGNDLR